MFFDDDSNYTNSDWTELGGLLGGLGWKQVAIKFF